MVDIPEEFDEALEEWRGFIAAYDVLVATAEGWQVGIKELVKHLGLSNTDDLSLEVLDQYRQQVESANTDLQAFVDKFGKGIAKRRLPKEEWKNWDITAPGTVQVEDRLRPALTKATILLAPLIKAKWGTRGRPETKDEDFLAAAFHLSHAMDLTPEARSSGDPVFAFLERDDSTSRIRRLDVKIRLQELVALDAVGAAFRGDLDTFEGRAWTFHGGARNAAAVLVRLAGSPLPARKIRELSMKRPSSPPR